MRLCNVSNITFPGIDGEALFIHLDKQGIAASIGSACSSGSIEASRVLINMGISTQLARSTLRFSFSRMNTKEETEKAERHEAAVHGFGFCHKTIWVHRNSAILAPVASWVTTASHTWVVRPR